MAYVKKITDVHTAHCCILHGCKYGDDTACTVKRGLAAQSYLCEDCPELTSKLCQLQEYSCAKCSRRFLMPEKLLVGDYCPEGTDCYCSMKCRDQADLLPSAKPTPAKEQTVDPIITKEILFEKTRLGEQGDDADTVLERWTLSRDTRHGEEGWRACRYLPAKDEPVFDWDESYMFFATLDDAVTAFENGNLVEGRKAF